MTFGPSGDLATFDGLVAVELWQPGAAEAIVVAGALRRAVKHREAAPAGGDYWQADTHWHLPLANLAERPRLGGLIVAPGGVAWTVLEVEEQTLGSRWRCAARELAIESGPNAEIDLQRPTWESDGAGAPRPRYESYAEGVPARVTRAAEAASVEQDERRGLDEIHVYLGVRLDVRPDDRLLHGAATYRVLRVVGLERLDRLPQLVVEETR